MGKPFWKPAPSQLQHGVSPHKGKPKQAVKVTKRGVQRSKKQRKIKQNKTLKFSVMGTNAAGLSSKVDSLVQNIKVFNNPSCIVIQETKMRKYGTVKLSNYQVFEKIRSGYGGGLLTAVNLNWTQC